MFYMKSVILIILLTLVPNISNDRPIITKKNTIDKKPKLNKIHKQVLSKFKVYNNKIDTNTVLKFVEVCDSFKLSEHMKTLTAQICYESRARQYKGDEVLTSPGNAQGICQVTPTTAYHYLNTVVSKNDSMLFKLGGTEYCHILECDEKYKRGYVIEWLSSETNNFIIYGYIMNNCMNRYRSIKRSLVDYSKGRGFLLRNESLINIDTLSYITHIRRIRDSR